MYYFITNREIIKKGKVESIRVDGREHAGDNLRFGRYDRNTKAFQLFAEPETDADITYADAGDFQPKELKGSARFFREIYDELCKDSGPKSDVLFFIHGFNTDLDGVRNDYEHLATRYVDSPNSPIKHIIAFTWPGMSPLIPVHYFDDRKDAIRSGEALARGIEKLIRFFKEFLVNADNKPCNRRIHFMVHSMGHRVLKHMMLELKKNRIPIPDLFHDIFLMAADIEYDIFERDEPFNSLIDLGKRIHVFFHREDRVLDISKYTKNFSNRLGRYGRKRVDPLLVDVIEVDATGYPEDLQAGTREKLLNHWYYYTSSKTVDQVISIFNTPLL